MATRKFSEETVTGSIQDTDVVPLSRDPDTTPVSWVARALTWKQYVLAGTDIAPLVSVVAADFEPYELPNGGSVASATITDVSGASLGLVEDLLQISITDPTPGVDALAVLFPITLVAGVPPNARLVLNRIPGTVLHEHVFGAYYESDNATSLSVHRSFFPISPANYRIFMTEVDPTSVDPATWQSATVPYVSGDTQDILLRSVVPFTVLPQIEARVILYDYTVSKPDIRVTFVPPGVSGGALNDSGAWTGAAWGAAGLSVIVATPYVGTITFMIQLAKTF